MGILPFVISTKHSVARPLAKIVVETWNPVISATAMVAGNMTITCCKAYSSSLPSGGRSSGRYAWVAVFFCMKILLPFMN